MTRFKSFTHGGCIFEAYQEPKSVHLLITLDVEDTYKPAFVYKLPKGSFPFIASLSRKEFIDFCINYINDCYNDFSKQFNL